MTSRNKAAGLGLDGRWSRTHCCARCRRLRSSACAPCWHAKDEAAKAFYSRWGFEPSPIDEFHLMLLRKDLRRNITG